jgi:FkbM family methyltransferase
MWGTRIRDLPFDLVVRGEVEIWRTADFWTKEPETIAWIDSIPAESELWDIGANIGVYSLYASELRINVTAFEPCRDNFERLLKNRLANDLDFSAHPFAFGDTPGKSAFKIPVRGVGMSGGQVGEARDELGRPFEPVESYDVTVRTIDDTAKEIGVPNYIKIDVDGHELAIIRGGVNTLQNPALRSVLVEANGKKDADEIERVMAASGFTSWNRFNAKDINKRHGQPARNVIYTRKG